MSLWTPYLEDVPLDLTKSAVDAQSAASYVPQPPPVPLPPHYLPVPYGGYYGAPKASPGGSSSGCGSASHSVVLSPPASLSPPGAPASRPSDTTDAAGALSDDPDFLEYERSALQVMAARNGGSLVGDNPRMRRSVHTSSAAAADATYRTQRERNNRAAKQSRDRRKLREIHLSLKAAYLQRRVVALQAALRRKVCGRCNRMF
ncbi:hypothetical protein PYW07_011965 [Mythimna separata]|uniref:BZIP domain-containing protein n=1 Tax=Mythimna separata TaxID=271217 RepID=A0AAD8DRY8_MYTSE|nr:hypothetical protein PYW07_011965 [Mythimna separata]